MGAGGRGWAARGPRQRSGKERGRQCAASHHIIDGFHDLQHLLGADRAALTKRTPPKPPLLTQGCPLPPPDVPQGTSLVMQPSLLMS